MSSHNPLVLDAPRSAIVLLARLLLATLFVWFGLQKLLGFEGTVGYMAQYGLPLPWIAATVAVLAEFVLGTLIALGLQVRWVALLLVLYTLATAFIGHAFWTMEGGERIGNMINFYKNVSIAGGFLLLSVTGAGRYALDAWLAGRRTAAHSTNMAQAAAAN